MSGSSEVTLQVYKNHSPTPLDENIALTGGLSCQNEWLIAPCSITRDSDSLALSNWHAQEQALREVDTGADFDMHRFGHWGPGWYEIVLVRPGSACERVARELAASLKTYPVLDETDWSERENEMAWQGVSAMQAIKDSRPELSERTMDILDNVSNDVLMDAINAHLNVEIEEDYPRIRSNRSSWARFLRAVRKANNQ